MEYHVNGELVSAENATVSVLDRGFRYGDAAFETVRAYGGELFAWEAHCERLQRTCETLGMDGAVPGDLALRIGETLDANELTEAYVRASVTRGIQPGKLTPQPAVDPTVVIVVSELPRGGLEGTSVWDEHATVQTVTTRRIPDSAMPSDAKTHNYLNGILARVELRNTDPTPDEALLRDTEDYIAEGATSNLFFVEDGVLKTPQCETILPGITREIVLDLAREETFPVEVGHYTLSDVREADEAFLTNTTWEIRPIERIDGIPIGDGPITSLLSRLFDERIEKRCYGSG